MTPYETAARWHLEHCPETPFRDVLEAHLFCGHVISGPERFVLGRQVCREWPEDRLLDPWDSDEQGDAWFVWLWAGEIGNWRAVVPFPLPWLMWHRGDRLKCFPLREVARARGRRASWPQHGQQTENGKTTATSAAGSRAADVGR